MNHITDPYDVVQGDSPLLVSMPHSGTALLPTMADRLTDAAQSLPDTDWFIPELYSFLNTMNVSIIRANYSRFVVDLNRPVDDIPLYSSKTTGLFPQILFSEQPVFVVGKTLTDEEKQQIKNEIWHPYHQHIEQELARIKAKFGYAILFDAHSIAARVPMLFEGTLPDFNFGTNDGLACSEAFALAVSGVVKQIDYSSVTNGRFKGGYITRHFGSPQHNIHAIQLELSQATYLTVGANYQLDPILAERVSQVLQSVINTILELGNPSHDHALNTTEVNNEQN
jgi:N-formylglutamate deformylase